MKMVEKVKWVDDGCISYKAFRKGVAFVTERNQQFFFSVVYFKTARENVHQVANSLELAKQECERLLGE